jgi:hypothetical protein
MNEIRQDEVALLAFLHRVRRATAGDLHKYACSAISRTQFYRRLARLVEGRYIAAEVLLPERGHGSPRIYRLLLKGARAIGLTSLSSAYYRKPRREVYQAQHIRHELALWAEHYGWRLLTTDEECRPALMGLLAALAYARYGERFPTHTIVPTNVKVRPDLLLETDKALVLIIIGHPQASATFWKSRMERYAPLLHAVRVAYFALTEQQHHDAAAVIAATGQARRCLLLSPSEVEDFVTQLAQEENPAPARM